MARITHDMVMSAYWSSDSRMDMAETLLAEIISQELQFSKSSERKATQAEAALADLLEDLLEDRAPDGAGD